MAGNWGEPERMWDEYEWERFLQQQDGKTEKYMQLLETYLDDPRRDEIIAREMGWTQLLDEKDWSGEVDALLDESIAEEDESEVDNPAASCETFQQHDLYRAAFDQTRLEGDHNFDECRGATAEGRRTHQPVGVPGLAAATV